MCVSVGSPFAPPPPPLSPSPLRGRPSPPPLTRTSVPSLLHAAGVPLSLPHMSSLVASPCHHPLFPTVASRPPPAPAVRTSHTSTSPTYESIANLVEFRKRVKILFPKLSILLLSSSFPLCPSDASPLPLPRVLPPTSLCLRRPLPQAYRSAAARPQGNPGTTTTGASARGCRFPSPWQAPDWRPLLWRCGAAHGGGSARRTNDCRAPRIDGAASQAESPLDE